MGKEIGGRLERAWKVDEGRGGLEEGAERMEKVRRRIRRLEEVWKKFGEGPQLSRTRTAAGS